MPFQGLLDEKMAVPATVPDSESVTCPGCGETMYPRDADGRARHFYHVNGGAGGSCPTESPGVSATHARCVALAVATLQDQFDDQAARCGAEIDVDVAESGSGNRTRRADALVEFESESPYFGEGFIIEVQHRHDDKDVRMTTHDYLSVDYSVVWLSADVFDEEALDYSIVDTLNEATPDHFRGVARYAEALVKHKEREARLEEESDDADVKERPDDLPDDVPAKATITVKEINDNRYYYWQW